MTAGVQINHRLGREDLLDHRTKQRLLRVKPSHNLLMEMLIVLVSGLIRLRMV